MRFACVLIGLLTAAPAVGQVPDNVVVFGDLDRAGNGGYPGVPWGDAALFGLPANQTSYGPVFAAAGPVPPAGPSDFQRTDRVLTGTGPPQDGYANPMNNPLAGPHTFTLDYGSAVRGGSVETLTLGVMLIDVQPSANVRYALSVNGTTLSGFSAAVNGLDQAGQAGQFISYGVPTELLTANNQLTFTIDQGTGGDGFAVDFVTVGVTPVPEPAGLLAVGLAAWRVRRRR